jgi:hypothetical protein
MKRKKKLRFEVLKAASMKMAVCWGVVPSGRGLPTFQ